MVQDLVVAGMHACTGYFMKISASICEKTFLHVGNLHENLFIPSFRALHVQSFTKSINGIL